ncbi:MAG: hypothetical protein QOC77_3542 [Thermoleophilaceae bacterium]|nr:hypothetical protein [Thermoleophilaceae bacterium]
MWHGEDPSAVAADAARYGGGFAHTVEVHAVAAKQVYDEFVSSEDRKAACLTLDAVNAAGGVDKTDEQKILEFAQQQFDRRAKAEEFAMNLDKLSQLDLSVVPSLYCAAYDMREPAS